jgi:epoxyqueuosine reductase
MGRAPKLTTPPAGAPPRQAPDREEIRRQAYALGFDPVGMAPLGPVGTWAAFERWLEQGRHGTMAWLERDAVLRRDTRTPHRGARSAIVVGLDYGGRQPGGTIARYARGRDYHDVMKERLRQLLAWIEHEAGRRVSGRPYVDTGPILERDLGRLAGLGWFGRNSMLIDPRRGSFFFIGALFVDFEIEPDPPFESEHCGTCRRCIDACPTGAIVDDGVIDATRCISYLTIEHRGIVPLEWRLGVGEHVFGCDICQDVCPWNERFSSEARDHGLTQGVLDPSPDPLDLVRLDDAAFRKRFGGTAVTRARRQGLVRNAALAIGNRGRREDLPILRTALESETDPVVAEHLEWAIRCLDQLGSGNS